MQDIFTEYMVKRRTSYKTILAAAGLIIAGVIVSAAALFFSAFLGELAFLGTLLAAGAIYGAYFLITSMNVEFEYAVTNGEMDVDKIVARRRRKRLITLRCREAEDFGRYIPEEHDGKSYQTKIFACDDPGGEKLWFCVARDRQQGLTLVVFNANDKMLDAVKPFLPRTLSQKAFQAEA